MPKNDVSVEIFYGGVWNDITKNDEVFTDAPIVITQGAADDIGSIRPCQISMNLNNTSDKYRISNPMSPLYRLIARGSSVRVSVGGVVRGIAEINSWKCDQTRDFRKTPFRGKAWTSITASGVLARISGWGRRIRSSLFREITLSTGYTIGEYWSMESPEGSYEVVSDVGGNALKPVTQIRYTLPDGTVLPPGGMPELASGSGILGSDPLPGFQRGGTLAAPVRKQTYNGYAIDWVMQFQANTADSFTSADLMSWTEDGTYVSFTVNVTLNAITVLHANAADHATLASTGSATANISLFDGAPHHFRYQVRQNGGNYLATFLIDSALYATADNFVPGMTGTVGKPTSIQWNPGETTADYMPVACGHLVIWASGQVGGQPPVFDYTNGKTGEKTTSRLLRVFGEENIDYTPIGNTSLAKLMGPQKSDTLFNLCQEVIRTEDGLMFDGLVNLGVNFKLLNSRYNQTPTMTLYPTDLGLIPLEDSASSDVYNSVTVTQRDGASSIAIDSTGFLGTLPPPLGAGEQKQEINVNMYTPSTDLAQRANWWLKRGTVDLPKYPELELDLGANPSLIKAANNLVPGAVIEIIGMRENVIRLYVLGWTETIGTHSRKMVLICKPDKQFNAGKWDADRKWDSSSHFLKTSVGINDTSLTFRSLSSKIVWGTNYPYDVMISGERMTVINMGGATLVSGGYDQVATVVRGANGVFKPLKSNQSVSVVPSAVWGV